MVTESSTKQVMRREINRLTVLEQHKIAFKPSVLDAQLVEFLACVHASGEAQHTPEGDRALPLAGEEAAGRTSFVIVVWGMPQARQRCSTG